MCLYTDSLVGLVFVYPLLDFLHLVHYIEKSNSILTKDRVEMVWEMKNIGLKYCTLPNVFSLSPKARPDQECILNNT